jgi:hypothetical protein
VVRYPAIGLVALDLDGTLLGRNDDVSPANLRAVRTALELGVRVVVVTGRGASDLPGKTLRRLGLDLPVICAHGALTIDSSSGAILRHVPVPTEHALRMVEHAERCGFNAAAYCDDRFWCFEGNPTGLDGLRGTDWHRVSSLAEVVKRRSPTFLRFFGRATVDAMFETFADLPLHLKHEVWETFDECAVTSSQATKEIALARLCAELGVPAGEVLAVGDSRNDVPMLAWAGIGVAMGNALPDVRRRVGRVTADCASDGVARAIERYVLEAAETAERSA